MDITKPRLVTLFYMHKFFFTEIFQTLSGKFNGLLSWSHYVVLLQVPGLAARVWYEKEVAEPTRSGNRNPKGDVLSTAAGKTQNNSKI